MFVIDCYTGLLEVVSLGRDLRHQGSVGDVFTYDK